MRSCHLTDHAPWWRAWLAVFCATWLLLPQPSFGRDSWCACACCVAAPVLLACTHGPWLWPRLLSPLIALALVPLWQWAAGQIYFAGTAWLPCAYLLGFAMLVWCGHRWEHVARGHGLDFLFKALGLAALLTVAMQCLQWLAPASLAPWWLDWSNPQRPAGNLGQPNNAATFLCWGLCALAWAAARGHLGFAGGSVLAAFLLWGVALTGSRTACVGLLLVLVATVHWRARLPSRRVLWLVLGLALYFAMCVGLVARYSAGTDGAQAHSVASIQERLQIWHMALQALADQPWFGFGWGQIYAAHLTVADRFPALHSYFNSAHNLVLDLLLCNGLLLGGGIALGGALWLTRVVSWPSTAQDMVLVFFVLLTLNHAMFELPLQYAYMLLPLAWVVGALECRLDPRLGSRLQVPRAGVSVLMATAAVLLGLVVADCLRLEAYRQEQLKFALVPTQPGPPLPDLYLLTHLRAQLELPSYPVLQPSMDTADLRRLEAIARLSPEQASTVKVATALAMHGEAERARWWLRRVCKLSATLYCMQAQATWALDSRTHPEIAAIPWPQNADSDR